MDEAERLEQIGVDVSGEIGRDRQRQRHQPQQRAAAAEIIARDQPRGAGTEQKRQRTDTGEQERGVEQRRRQHIVDQVVPHFRRRLHGKRHDRDDGSRDQDRRHHRDCRGDPAGVDASRPASGRSLFSGGVNRSSTLAPALSSGQERGRSGEVSCQSRPCPPALPPPCGLRRSSRSAGCRHSVCRSPQWWD